MVAKVVINFKDQNVIVNGARPGDQAKEKVTHWAALASQQLLHIGPFYFPLWHGLHLRCQTKLVPVLRQCEWTQRDVLLFHFTGIAYVYTQCAIFHRWRVGENVHIVHSRDLFSIVHSQIQIRKSSSKPNTFSSCCCEETFCLADDKCCSKPKQAQCRLSVVYICSTQSNGQMAIFAIFNRRFEMLTWYSLNIQAGRRFYICTSPSFLGWEVKEQMDTFGGEASHLRNARCHL